MLFDHQGAIEIVEGPPPVAGVDIPEGLDARESLPPIAGPGRLMSWDEFSGWERGQVSSGRIDEWQPDDLVLFEHTRASVPAPWSWPPAPDNIDSIWWSLVAPAWPRFAGVLARFAAAKIFASWSAYLDDGVEGVTRATRVAAAVLRVECARQCAVFGRPLDRELLIEAIRQTDLLLVHLADQDLLTSSTDRLPG